jgi:hypothetical protein
MSTLRAQGQRPSQTRNATNLNHKLDRKLAAYMAAAGAAGVGMLALAQPAEAKVVYTSANISIGFNRVAIDLNNDGTNDFYFFVGGGGSNEVFLYVSAPNGNGWFGNSQAQPAFFGVPFGPGEKFLGSFDIMAAFFGGSFGSGSGGLWAGKTNRYMGMKFMINGSPHFGWARISVVNESATITGYAYETIPNQSLKAGYTSGPATKTSSVPAAVAPARRRLPATLGMLSRGADALAIWRNEEVAA